MRWLWWLWFQFVPMVPALLLCFELRLLLELRLLDRTVLRLPEDRTFLRRSGGRRCSRGTGDHAGSRGPCQGSVRLTLLESMGNNGPGLFEKGPGFVFCQRVDSDCAGQHAASQTARR